MGRQRRKDLLDLAVGVILFGSLWGLLEATLGGLLHALKLPYTGAIMANLGFAVMAAAVAVYKRSTLPAGIGLVAASFKLLDVLIFSLSPLARAVVNPAMAIILEALAFQGVVSLLWRPYQRRELARAGTGLAGMYLSYVGIALVFFYILGRGPKDVTDPLGLVGFAIQDGTIAALAGLIAAPLGHRFGELLRARKERLAARNPRLLYRGALVLTAACWLAAALSLLLM
ncbi:MAG: hypothetical protein ACUVQU_04195 [Candidatus Bipolaricaulia bacterium]